MAPRKKTHEKEPSVRETLGLSAAEAGDPAGLERFLNFAEREFSSLGYFSNLPEELRIHLRSIQGDIKNFAKYTSGFIAGQRHKT